MLSNYSTVPLKRPADDIGTDNNDKPAKKAKSTAMKGGKSTARKGRAPKAAPKGQKKQDVAEPVLVEARAARQPKPQPPPREKSER